VRFVIAHYFATSNISVLRDCSEYDEEKCISTEDVSDSLEEATAFVAKTAVSKGLEMEIPHECHVFHIFPLESMNDDVDLVLPRPIVGSQGDDHMRSINAAEVALGQVARR
jgi:hypothetical protein